MSPKNSKDQRSIRQRLRHSDSAIQRARQRKSSLKKSPQKSPNKIKKRLSPVKPSSKTHDVEPVKKRLRSAGDYKLSITFDDPEHPKKSTPACAQKSSPTKKSPKKLKSTTPIKSPDKQPKSSFKFKTPKEEPLSSRTPSPINKHRLARSTEKMDQKPKTPLSPSKNFKKTPTSSKKTPTSSKKTPTSSKKTPTSSKKTPTSSKKANVQVKKEIDVDQPRTVTSVLRRPATIKVELPDTSVTPNLPKTPR
jgi:hypothetical protein